MGNPGNGHPWNAIVGREWALLSGPVSDRGVWRLAVIHSGFVTVPSERRLNECVVAGTATRANGRGKFELLMQKSVGARFWAHTHAVGRGQTGRSKIEKGKSPVTNTKSNFSAIVCPRAAEHDGGRVILLSQKCQNCQKCWKWQKNIMGHFWTFLADHPSPRGVGSPKPVICPHGALFTSTLVIFWKPKFKWKKKRDWVAAHTLLKESFLKKKSSLGVPSPLPPSPPTSHSSRGPIWFS